MYMYMWTAENIHYEGWAYLCTEKIIINIKNTCISVQQFIKYTNSVIVKSLGLL